MLVRFFLWTWSLNFLIVIFSLLLFGLYTIRLNYFIKLTTFFLMLDYHFRDCIISLCSGSGRWQGARSGARRALRGVYCEGGGSGREPLRRHRRAREQRERDSAHKHAEHAREALRSHAPGERPRHFSLVCAPQPPPFAYSPFAMDFTLLMCS